MKIIVLVEYDTDAQQVCSIKEQEREGQPGHFKGPNPMLAVLTEAAELLKFHVNIGRMTSMQQAAMQQAQNAAIASQIAGGNGTKSRLQF